MPFDGTVAVVGLDRARHLLKSLGDRARDLRPVLAGDITTDVHKMFAEQFDSAGTYGGTPWAPLHAATLAKKARRRRAGMGILRFTNTLWASLVKRSHPLGRRVVTRDSLSIGTNVPYAEAHQTGTRRMVRRPLLPDDVPQERLDKWDSLVVDYLEAAPA